MKTELQYYGGQGYDWSKDVGEFEVRASTTVTFRELHAAISYYESLDEEKSLWDVTTSVPELLECHALVFPIS